MALFLVPLLFLNHIIVLTRSHLSTAQASSSFKWLDTHTYVYFNHAHLQNWSAPSCYWTTAVLNDCYSEVTAYTALAYSVFMMRMDTKATPTDDTKGLAKTIELSQPTI